MVRVAINGFGRIGRMFFRAAKADGKLEIVAVNDLTDSATLAHLLKYDSVHGKYPGSVSAKGKNLVVDGKVVQVLSEKDPANLPWKKLKIDAVVESTGFFLTKELAQKHIDAGAKKVLISAPPKSEIDMQIVKGVNDKNYKKSKHNICSNASCTTNSLAPIVKVLHDTFGVKKGFLTTVHAYTNDQKILDLPHKDLRRARAAAINTIPTTTGAAKSVAEVIPSLKGKLDGMAIRVPVPTGSVTDFNCLLAKKVTKEEVNAAFKKAAATYMKGVIEYSEEELVSTDIIGNKHSSIFDSKLTNVVDGNLVKVVAWYDNEIGFSNRMVDVIKTMMK